MLPTKEASVHVGSDKSLTPGHIYTSSSIKHKLQHKNLVLVLCLTHTPGLDVCPFESLPRYTSNTRDETIVERPGHVVSVDYAVL